MIHNQFKGKSREPYVVLSIGIVLMPICIRSLPQVLHVGKSEPTFQAVFRIRIHQIHMFLGHPDPLVNCMDPAPDPSIIMPK